jgi:molybdate transport system substrate-binding protein
MARRLATLFLLLLVCWAGAAKLRAQPAGPLVLAASSLQEALGAAAEQWTAKGHPRPVLSFAASSALARQIAAGAPADLFISADEEWMDDLAGRGAIRPASRESFLSNRLVLISPRESAVRLAIRPGFPLARALGSGRLAVADPQSVPAGRYAREALTSLGVWRSVERRLAPSDNVRAALALVERGEAPLGIVYATDARTPSRVRVVGRFPAATHRPIRYPLALLRRSSHREAEAFRRFLVSHGGRAVFARFGFGTGPAR